MGQVVFQLGDLPDAPLDAAAHFLSETMPFVRELLAGQAELPGLAEELDALALVFPAGSKEQQGWRLAVVQELAREAAPLRVNAVAGDDQDAIDAATDWLAQAPGVTGQLLPVEASAAGNSGI